MEHAWEDCGLFAEAMEARRGVARWGLARHDGGRDQTGVPWGARGWHGPGAGGHGSMLRWRRLGFRWGAGSGYKNRGSCVRGQAGVGPPFDRVRLGRRRPSGYAR